MTAATGDPLSSTALTTTERETVRRFASGLDRALGKDLHALWLYGSRARGESHAESDVDLLVIAEGGRERYQGIAWDLSEEVATASGESPFTYSVQVHDLEWLQGRRGIGSFFIQEVDRDKLVLLGGALE